MRFWMCLVALATVGFSADSLPAHQTLQGKLELAAGKPPILVTADHKRIILGADETESQVLADQRVNGFDVQVTGHFTAEGHFLIDPAHHHPLLVRQNGHLKLITYWCDVCSIRSYTPGPCACCQKETALDLRDPDKQ
jgi:hypothetical protein